MSRPLKLKVMWNRVLTGFPTPRPRVYRQIAGAYRKPFFREPEEQRLIPQPYPFDVPVSVAKLMERVRSHDDDLYAHSSLVGRLLFTFAAHLGFSVRDQRLLGQAALLHDVGKLRIETSVLHKPTTLDEHEWFVMRTHPSFGVWILLKEGIKDAVVLDIRGNHHERLDGMGYPAGISGKQVSEAVRVITLCDVFAAMTEKRRYGKPHTWRVTLELMAEKRTQLDLVFLKHFAAMIEAQYKDSGQLWSFASCLQGRGEICPKAS